MGRMILTVAATLLFLAGCNRNEEDFLWEYTAGQGTARVLAATPDSGFISAGDLDGRPYLLKSRRTGTRQWSYHSALPGSFRAILYDTAWCIVAGGNGSELIISSIDIDGELIWEKRIPSPVGVTEVFLFRGESEGEIVALCGSGPDDPADLTSGIMKVVFDTSGAVFSDITRTESDLFRISGAVMNSDGGFHVAVTRATGTAKPKAVVLKLSSTLATIRERELANNPSYGAASLDLCISGSAGIIVSGRTELVFNQTLLMNSFVASLSSSGEVLWKKYPESSNEASAVLSTGPEGLVYVLNRNCYIVTILNEADGSENRMIRFFSACDSYDTQRRAEAFIITWNGNLLVAGTNSGKYYFALKPVNLE